jgi:hypothetical protein
LKVRSSNPGNQYFFHIPGNVTFLVLIQANLRTY